MPGWLSILAAAALAAAPGERRPPLFTDARDVPASAAPRTSLPDLSRVAEGAVPAVVGIVTTQPTAAQGPAGDPLKDLLERFHGHASRKGLATGFVIQADGYIVTNAHVVEDAARVDVDLGEDGERVPARVIGRDDASDIALLKVQVNRPLPVLALGDSDRLRLAEWVMVVGNPFGLSRSVTIGIVSHTGRADVVPGGRDGFYDFIQTDASINPGNSGGPVLNARGEVIGIATAINATGQGIGFAVPVNMVKEILGQLRDHGRVVRSWMGVSVREARAGNHGGRAHDLVVTNVVSGSPAAAGGVQVGDVITGFDGRAVPSAARLRWYVATAGVGRAVALTVRRGAGEQALHVELGVLPGERNALVAAPAAPPSPAASGTGSRDDAPEP